MQESSASGVLLHRPVQADSVAPGEEHASATALVGMKRGAAGCARHVAGHERAALLTFMTSIIHTESLLGSDAIGLRCTCSRSVHSNRGQRAAYYLSAVLWQGPWCSLVSASCR